MKHLKTISFFLLLIMVSCQKETPESPINQSDIGSESDCATCPSLFYATEDVPVEEDVSCDDFTDMSLYPEAVFMSSGIIGYAQDGSQALSAGDFTTIEVNNATEGRFGLYGNGSLIFPYDSEQQHVQFTMYTEIGSFDEMGIVINGVAVIYLDETFPQIVDGVEVNFDLSTPDIEDWEIFELTFFGEIESISHILSNSGVIEQCIIKETVGPPPTIDKTEDVYFDDFYDYNGNIIGAYPNYKTPLGYYGIDATSLSVDFDSFLAYSPTRLSFVHAYLPDESALINVQLPGTPLIVTIPDSLDFYLTPYGYSAVNYHETEVSLWQDLTSPPLGGAVMDSIVITGTNMTHVTLGANLQESELRSICTYYKL